MSEIGTVASTGSQTRNGAFYSPKNARLSWIDPTQDLPYEFIPKDGDVESAYYALAKAAESYNGNVRCRLPDNEIRPLKQVDDGVWDNFIWQSDGRQERCDDDGKTNLALKFLVPVQGVVALPDNPDTPIPVVLPIAHGVAQELPYGAGVLEGHTQGFGENEWTWIIAVPEDAPASGPTALGSFQIVETPGQPVIARHLLVTRDDEDALLDEDVGNTAPMFYFRVNEPAERPGSINFEPGRVYNVTARNVKLRESGFPTADVKWRFRTPGHA